MATPLKKPRERDVERHLVRRAVELGGQTWKWSSPAVRGVPDRIVTLRGRTLAVECKAPGHKPTAVQERQHALLRRHGWRVEVVDSIEAVEALLRAL
jgi:Holliday junction resolvase